MNRIIIGIFVGGSGKRMGGVAKGLLPAPASSETLVERLLRVCQEALPDAAPYLVGQSAAYATLGLPQLCDEPSEIGPIGGLRSLLLCAQRVGAPQALALFNSAFMLSQAGKFAERVQKEHTDNPGAAIEGAWELALGRAPSPAEKEQALRFLAEEKSMANLCLVLLNMNEFLYID